MKKILAIFILIVVCTTLFSCNSGKNNVDTDDSVNTFESTETEDLSKKLSEMGEMDFTIVSDNGKEIIPYKYYYGGQLYGSSDEMTYFGTGKILGFDINECIDKMPEIAVQNGFSVKTDKNVDVVDTIEVFDANGEKIYSGDVSVENIKALSGGKDCIVSLTVRRNGTGKYSDEYSMYLMLIKVRFE